jgi:Spy/CpxP family protein refolding chaperone
MMKLNKLIISVFTLLLALSSLGAYADETAVGKAGWPMMGPGMMGQGYGMMGHGMMGQGYGMMGHGMMGYGPMWLSDLKEDQQKKISAIYEDLHKKRWDLMTKMQGEYAILRGLYAEDQRDPAAIGNQYKKISDLRRQMVELSVDAHNRMEVVLTKEQKALLRSYGPGWMMMEE